MPTHSPNEALAPAQVAFWSREGGAAAALELDGHPLPEGALGTVGGRERPEGQRHDREIRRQVGNRRYAALNSTSCAPSQSVSLPSAGRFSSPEVSVMKWLPASWPIFDAK